MYILSLYPTTVSVQGAPPVVGRFVPFLAVATANCINIPMMRQSELHNGVTVLDEDGQPLGQSRVRQLIMSLTVICVCACVQGFILRGAFYPPSHNLAPLENVVNILFYIQRV